MKRIAFAATLLATSTAWAHGPDAHPGGIGEPGSAAAVGRTIQVEMHDSMRFTPPTITVKRGETVRFVVHNAGARVHEFMLGEIGELRSHAEVMRKHPEMIHDEPNAVTVEPGKTAELVWKFTQAGKVDFACLLPGHFEAGMQGRVEVRK
jgi:uncharacterized cupredoxin-like copper-binding protein